MIWFILDDTIEEKRRRLTMDIRLLIIIIFTIIIHATETLTYSIRLGGIKLSRILVAMSLTGIILLVSRTANMVQGPLVGGIVDAAKATGDINMVLTPFRYILLSASIGTLLALFLYPTFTKLSIFMIKRFEVDGSIHNESHEYPKITVYKRIHNDSSIRYDSPPAYRGNPKTYYAH
mgnify:CR=1 FL=1